MFPAENLTFSTTANSWLVVTKPKAILQVTGTINGTGNYTLLLSGIDGSLPGSGGTDKIRIKIVNASNTIIYDSQMGQPITADPTTTLTNGLIRIR